LKKISFIEELFQNSHLENLIWKYLLAFIATPGKFNRARYGMRFDFQIQVFAAAGGAFKGQLFNYIVAQFKRVARVAGQFIFDALKSVFKLNCVNNVASFTLF
jgi:hypothetical protein